MRLSYSVKWPNFARIVVISPDGRGAVYVRRSLFSQASSANPGSPATPIILLQEGVAILDTSANYYMSATPIYKVSMREARWGAVFPDTFTSVLMIGVKCSPFRVKAAHIVDLTHW